MPKVCVISLEETAHHRNSFRKGTHPVVVTLLVGTLAGVFITSSGIILAADTALTQPGKPVTFERKIEITGDRSAAIITGTTGWEVNGVAADFTKVLRSLARQMGAVPIALQLERIVEAFKRELRQIASPASRDHFKMVRFWSSSRPGTKDLSHRSTSLDF
jgi:hypothetical protein